MTLLYAFCTHSTVLVFELTHGQDAANRIADTDDLEKKANFEHALLEEDSPYFEVRASVRNYDEDMPANTIRVSNH